MATFAGGVVVTALAAGVVALLAVRHVIGGVVLVLVSVAVPVIVLPLVAFSWNLAMYLWRTRGSDDWRGLAFVAGNAISFLLQRQPTALPERFDSHLQLRCRMTAPDGAETVEDMPVPGASYTGADARLAFVDGVPVFGRYVVHWYGSRRPGRFYELTSVRFDLDAVDMGKPVVGSPATLRWRPARSDVN